VKRNESGVIEGEKERKECYGRRKGMNGHYRK